MLDNDWITSEQTLEAIGKLSATSVDGNVSAKQLLRLREIFSVEQSQFIACQVRLRQQAGKRFPNANQMLFTRLGLQQTTDAGIATYKADLIRKLAADTQHVTDLCCGIGGDLQAFSQHFAVTGVDQDSMLCQLARHNATLNYGKAVNTIPADVTEFTLDTDWVHLDPDRRHDGLRHTDIQSFAPDLPFMNHLIDQVGKSIKGILIKLAPATQIPDAWVDKCQLQWLQSRNECRQQLALFTPLTVDNHKRSAVAVTPSGKTAWAFEADQGELLTARDVPLSNSPVRYIYEPSPAVLAANLAPTWAAQHDLKFIHSGVAYLSKDSHQSVPGGACYRVVDQLPYDLKKIRKWISEHDIGSLEIKKRGIELTPEQVRKQLKPKGSNSITLIVAGNPHTQKTAAAYFAENL